MEPFPDMDIAIEVLSRLPAKSLAAFKCTAKRWNCFLSDLSFLRLHDKRSKDIFGLLFQKELFDLVSHTKISQTESIVESTFLDFLPEKVVLVASSNGVLCCRSWVYDECHDYHIRRRCKDHKVTRYGEENLSLYICNPITREWIRIRPKQDNATTLIFGLASHTFCSSSPTGSSFQLVNLRQLGSSTYSFAIYSSETQKWEMSKEVFEFNSYVFPSKVVFCNKTFHWLTKDNHILTFNVGNQSSKLLKLPGVHLNLGVGPEYGICFGESEGYFHYICVVRRELKVWILRDYEEPAWKLKYSLYLAELYKQHPILAKKFIGREGCCGRYPCNHPPVSFVPFGFYEDVIYARILVEDCSIFSYDFKTGAVIKQCIGEQIGGTTILRSYITIPYRVSLLPLPLTPSFQQE